MICAPARAMSPALSPRTTPWVPTGMKAGVATVPWGRVSRPARARPWVASSWNSNISSRSGGAGRDGNAERDCHPSLRSGWKWGGLWALAPTPSLPRRPRRREHPIDLPTMDQVVAAHHADDEVEALRPPLAMDPDPRELRRRERAPEPQVGGPHPTQLAKCHRQVGGTIVQVSGPGILVVALDRRLVQREDLTGAPGVDDFGVGQVLDDFERRPLAGRLRAAQDGVVQPGGAPLEPGGELARHGERVAIAEDFEDGTGVAGRRSGRVARRVGEGHVALPVRE